MNTQNSQLKTPHGFSLIELVFAMFFLTIIIFGVISLQSSNLAMITSQNKEIQAHFYANQGAVIAEVLGAAVIASKCVSPPCDLFLDTSGDPYQFSENEEWIENGFFRRSIKIESLAFKSGGPALSSVYKISSVINWTDGTGDHSVSAKRIIY